MNRSLCTLVAVLFGATSIAHAADGTAVGVDPDAVARAGSSERILHVGADISLGEEIVTGPSGKVQIVFADETRLVVGPQSALLIESYLMAGDPNDKFAINALAGSFRFMSGNGPKSAYSIQTPTASIAVRGTKFDVAVGDGQTDVLLFEGAVTVCTSGGVCQELSQFCDIASFGGGGAAKIGHGDRAHGAAGRKFNFARFPSTVMGDFRVSGATQCMSPPQSSPAPASLSAADSGEKIAVPKEPTNGGGDDNGSGGTDNNGGEDTGNTDGGSTDTSGGGTGNNGGSTGNNGGSTGNNGGSTGNNGGSTGNDGGSTGNNGGSTDNNGCSCGGQ